LTGSLVPSLDPIARAVRPRRGLIQFAFSRDGNYVATADVRMNVSVRHGDRTLFTEEFHSENPKAHPTERIRGVDFGAEPSLLFVAAGDTIRAIAWETGEQAWSYTAPKALGFLIVLPIALAVSPQGHVAASFENGAIIVWSPSGEILSHWRDIDLPRAMSFVEDGTLVGCDHFALAAWDPRDGLKLFRRRLRTGCLGWRPGSRWS
jgi:hypothetical protein